jgi:hypothetical protein
MEKDPIPQATSPLATWLSYLEHLHSKTIDLGLARVSEVAGQMDIVKPAPFVYRRGHQWQRHHLPHAGNRPDGGRL